jgi:hypothetical protein
MLSRELDGLAPHPIFRRMASDDTLVESKAGTCH